VTVEVYALLVNRQLKRWPGARHRESCWMSANDVARSVKEPGITQLLLRLKEILAAALTYRLAMSVFTFPARDPLMSFHSNPTGD
jgi:hypothetical protein